MRGLICKDLRLMMVQKNFLIMLAAVALVSLAAMDDPMFVIMYMTLMISDGIDEIAIGMSSCIAYELPCAIICVIPGI